MITPPSGGAVVAMDTSQAAESFRGLLLRHRGRTGLTQRELAGRLGANRRTVQDWETGGNYPSAENLKSLVRVLLEAGSLSEGHEVAEAHELWAAVLREAQRMQTPFDHTWFAGLLAARGPAPPVVADEVLQSVAAAPPGRTDEHVQDWGEAPDALSFVGRAEELATLGAWVLEEHCRVAALLGIGGIGKTSLAARLAQEVAPSFRRVYWRSMRDAPPTSEWLAGAIGFLSDQQLVPPASESERIISLLQLLRTRRCLLALDNFETLLEPGQREAGYRAGYDGYGRLLQAIGETRHQSCVLLTSREAPPELATLGGAARRLELGGLGVPEGQVLLADKGLSGSTDHWAELVARFGGNGLALKVVSDSIRQVFGGDISAYLEQSGGSTAFGGIRRLLAEQIGRSSTVELDVLRMLAVEREPVSVRQLIADLGLHAGTEAVLQALEALRRRSLVERAESAVAAAFTLQSVVLEYVTDRLVEEVAEEIAGGRPARLMNQPLIKAQAKDYVRQTQERLIGEPVLRHLHSERGTGTTDQLLTRLLDAWRDCPPEEHGYGPGNVVNLLRLQRGHLRRLDLSRLSIRQAYLAQVEAQDASLVDTNVAESVLAGGFDLPDSVALSGDGGLLAAGTITGQVWLWRVADRTPLLAVQGHVGGARGVALSADGQLLASGGGDGTVRLWDTGTGRSLATLQGQTGGIWSLALSDDCHRLASGGFDGTVRVWSLAGEAGDVGVGAGRTQHVEHSPAAHRSEWRVSATLQGHAGGVRGLALSADGRLLASGGEDGLVRLWQTSTGRPLATLQGHTGAVRRVALSADGELLASGGGDATARVWEANTGQLLATLHGHTGVVWGLALSADGRLLACAGGDGALRLWEARTGRPLATLQGHSGTIWGLALSADGRLLSSVGEDGTARLWDASTGRPLATLQGQTGTVWGVALSAVGLVLASAGGDGAVRLWEVGSGRPLATLHGHTGGVWGVALSADGHLLASGGADRTVRLWEVGSGRPLATLHGHTGGVWGVALSADGHLLASGGDDGTVRLWSLTGVAEREGMSGIQEEPVTGRSLATLLGHAGTVWGVAVSANGQLVASSGADGTVRLWEASTGQPLLTLQGHFGSAWHVALSADGHLLASSGAEGTVRLWSLTGVAEREGTPGIQEEAGTGQLLATLRGHTGMVWGVALSADGHLLASGGEDWIVRLWDASTERALATLQGHAGTVWGVVLSAEGHLLASGSFDGTVRLWETSSGTYLRTLRSERPLRALGYHRPDRHHRRATRCAPGAGSSREEECTAAVSIGS